MILNEPGSVMSIWQVLINRKWWCICPQDKGVTLYPMKYTLKRKGRHFDDFFISGYTGGCLEENLQCSQWWKVISMMTFPFQCTQGWGLLEVCLVWVILTPVVLKTEYSGKNDPMFQRLVWRVLYSARIQWLLISDLWISFIIPPASTKLQGGYTGFTLSVFPSVDRIFNNAHWIHFIFAHLIKQLQMVCRV